jgi:hypothetical protein
VVELEARITVDSDLSAKMGREVGFSGTIVEKPSSMGFVPTPRFKLVVDETKFEVTR